MNSFVRISIVSKLLRPTVFWSRSIWRARAVWKSTHSHIHVYYNIHVCTYIYIYIYVYNVTPVRLRVDGHTRPVQIYLHSAASVYVWRYIIRIRPRAFHFNLAPLFYFFTPPYIVYIYIPLDDSVRRSSPKIYSIGRGVAATRIDPPGASGPAVVVTQPFVDRTHYSQLPAFPVAGVRVGLAKSYIDFLVGPRRPPDRSRKILAGRPSILGWSPRTFITRMPLEKLSSVQNAAST